MIQPLYIKQSNEIDFISGFGNSVQNLLQNVFKTSKIRFAVDWNYLHYRMGFYILKYIYFYIIERKNVHFISLC